MAVRGLISFLAGVVLASFSTVNVESVKTENIFNPAKEYKIGDRVPEFPAENMLDKRPISNHILMMFYDSSGKLEKEDVNLGIMKCKEEYILFGFYDKNKRRLYLDNKPNDGIIDGIITGFPERNIMEDAPKCPIKI